MKLIIDTTNQRLILTSDETYSIDELYNFIQEHGFIEYKIYSPHTPPGHIFPIIDEEKAKEFTTKWREAMEKNYHNIKWRPLEEPILKPPFYPTCNPQHNLRVGVDTGFIDDAVNQTIYTTSKDNEVTEIYPSDNLYPANGNFNMLKFFPIDEGATIPVTNNPRGLNIDSPHILIPFQEDEVNLTDGEINDLIFGDEQI